MRKMTGEEFDQLVDFFDGMVLTRWLSNVHTELKKLTGKWTGLSVLDVGCGTGRLLLRGIDEAEHVTGVDISREMIQSCIDNTKGYSKKASFFVCDACELPFNDHSFDLSLSTCVLFLLPEPELGIKEMFRVTKTGGKIVMLNPAMKMNNEEAHAFSDKYQLTNFEKKTLLQWAKVSTRRHRYDEKQLTLLLQNYGAKSIQHEKVLDGLALITIATV